jgi:hypothetical protein
MLVHLSSKGTKVAPLGYALSLLTNIRLGGQVFEDEKCNSLSFPHLSNYSKNHFNKLVCLSSKCTKVAPHWVCSGPLDKH